MIAPCRSIAGAGHHRTLGPDEPLPHENCKMREDGKGGRVGRRRVEALADNGEDRRDRGVSGFEAREN